MNVIAMLKSIQSLRGIFALFIFLHHVLVFAAGGDSGVSFFIMLSGFVLCDGYQQKLCRNAITYKSFIVRRLVKNYPLHLLCLAAAFLLLFQEQHNPLVWLVNLLLLQSWFPNPAIHFSGNNVSWFLSVLLLCYGVFPFIIRFVEKSLRKFLLAVCALLVVYFIAIRFVPADMSNGVIYINPLFRLPDFILGILLWQILRKNSETLSSRISAMGIGTKTVIELGVIALFILTVAVYPYVSPRYGLVSLWWPVSVALIGVFSLFDKNGGIVSRLLQIKPLVFFGNMSFSFYMVHVLVIRTARRLLENIGVTISDATFILLVLGVAVVLAYVVWRYFEKPVTRFLLSRLPSAG